MNIKGLEQRIESIITREIFDAIPFQTPFQP